MTSFALPAAGDLQRPGWLAHERRNVFREAEPIVGVVLWLRRLAWWLLCSLSLFHWTIVAPGRARLFVRPRVNDGLLARDMALRLATWLFTVGGPVLLFGARRSGRRTIVLARLRRSLWPLGRPFCPFATSFGRGPMLAVAAVRPPLWPP